MFKPDADSFFTYAFVFAVSQDQKLTPDVIRKETLVYYQGLASSLLKQKGKDVDPEKFTFTLTPSKQVVNGPAGVDATSISPYRGTLNWIEPFATAKPQTLHFELHSWNDPKNKKNFLFVCVSPKAIDNNDAQWKKLREIRRTFEVKAAE